MKNINKSSSTASSKGTYEYLQNNVDIFVVQSPKELEDFIRIVKILTDILEYDQVRGLKNQKRVIMYGQTNLKNSDKVFKRSEELERVRITSAAGIYYLPLYEEERIGHIKYGISHEEKNSWHFMDTGQHFITQAFFNILELSQKCDTKKHV